MAAYFAAAYFAAAYFAAVCFAAVCFAAVCFAAVCFAAVFAELLFKPGCFGNIFFCAGFLAGFVLFCSVQPVRVHFAARNGCIII